MNPRTKLCKTLTGAVLPSALGFILALAPAPRCAAQTKTQAQPGDQPKVAELHEPQPVSAVRDGGTPSTPAPGAAAAMPDPGISPAVAKQFAAMQAEIEALKAELNRRAPAESAAPAAPPSGTNAAGSTASEPTVEPAAAAAQQSADAAPKTEKPEPSAPFAYADWSWLNGSPHNKDAVWDSKFFTPEIRFDTDYIYSFNHPRDDSLGGSTEIFRSNEIQVEQISFGGDFHWQNVRGRVLTMGGMFGVTTPRNDPSVGRGQWDLRGAYKYFAEAYGGYHFNVNHGLNVDAGIFVSYIGLFS